VVITFKNKIPSSSDFCQKFEMGRQFLTHTINSFMKQKIGNINVFFINKYLINSLKGKSPSELSKEETISITFIFQTSIAKLFFPLSKFE